MRMHEVSLFDPFAVVAWPNPSLFDEPFRFSVQDHVGRVLYLDPRRVKPMKRQPRSDAEQAKLEEMEASFRLVGQEETGLVFPMADPDFDAGLIGGHRRRLTCLRVGCMFRVEVRPAPANWKELYVKALAGNCNREDLSIRDLTEAVKELLGLGYSKQEISAIIGKSLQVVEQHITLGAMNPAVFPFLEENSRNDGVGARSSRTTALRLNDAVQVAELPWEDQPAAAQAIVDEGMSYEDALDFVRRRRLMRGNIQRRQRSSGKLFSLLDAGVGQLSRLLIDYYTELPRMAQRTLVSELDEEHRGNLARRLRWLTVQIESIADTLDPLKPVKGQDPSRWHPAMQSWLRKGLRAFEGTDVPLEEWLLWQGYTPRSQKLLEEWLAQHSPPPSASPNEGR